MSLELASILKQILEENDFETDVASSVDVLVRKILNKSYKLVVVDTDLLGRENCKFLETASNLGCEIIYISSLINKREKQQKEFHLGRLYYINKENEKELFLNEVKTRGEAKGEKQKELVEKTESNKKDEFIAYMGHELKTPLTSILGYTYLLERSLKKNDIETSIMKLYKIKHHIAKLNTLIDNMQDIPKIMDGKMILNTVPFELSHLINEVVEDLQQTYPDVRFLIKESFSGTINGDMHRIEQVILNLLTNAIKYSPHAKEIHIKSFLEAERVIFSVKDFGVGIHKDEISKIFDKFYRVDEISDAFQGLGIGLYISKEIIRLHHGDIGVNSEEGKGSEFYFSLAL